MKTSQFIFYFLALGTLLSLNSCEWLNNLINNGGGTDDPIACTEEFRTVGLEVIGAELDPYFTIRKSTNDTLEVNFEVFQSFYPVLSDAFQEELEGKVEEFVFVGFVEAKEVVRESFMIKADECHIEKVSGPDSVTID